MNGRMMDGMGSMMAWMMGIGLVGWVLLLALLVTIIVLLARIVGRMQDRERDKPGRNETPRGT